MNVPLLPSTHFLPLYSRRATRTATSTVANTTTRTMGTVMAALVPEETSLTTAETSTIADGRGTVTGGLVAAAGH